MADDFGRVHRVSPHFLDRGAREEPYQGRQSKKHQGHDQDASEAESESVEEVEAQELGAGSHIDLRI